MSILMGKFGDLFSLRVGYFFNIRLGQMINVRNVSIAISTILVVSNLHHILQLFNRFKTTILRMSESVNKETNE